MKKFSLLLFIFLSGLSVSYALMRGLDIALRSKAGYDFGKIEAKKKAKPSVRGNAKVDGFLLSADEVSFLWEKGIMGYEKKEEVQEAQNPATEPVIEEVVISPLSSTYKLLGTIIGESESFAFIMQRSSRKIEVKKLGDEIEPGAKISAIKFDRIEIIRGNRKEILFLFEQDEKKFASAGGSVPVASSVASLRPSDIIRSPRRPERREPARRGGGNMQVDLRQVGPNTFEVRREFVQKHLSNMASLLTSARAIPFIKNGKIQGFRLINIAPSSFFRVIGIRNGDVVKKINGIPVSNPESILKILTDIQNETYFEIEIERGGKSKVMKYYVR